MDENTNINTDGIQLPVAKIPASEAIQGTGTLKPITYPMVEELTFRAVIKSEAEGYALLRAVQIIVNEFGAESLITVMTTMEKKPELLQKAKQYLPYINIL